MSTLWIGNADASALFRRGYLAPYVVTEEIAITEPFDTIPAIVPILIL